MRLRCAAQISATTPIKMTKAATTAVNTEVCEEIDVVSAFRLRVKLPRTAAALAEAVRRTCHGPAEAGHYVRRGTPNRPRGCPEGGRMDRDRGSGPVVMT